MGLDTIRTIEVGPFTLTQSFMDEETTILTTLTVLSWKKLRLVFALGVSLDCFICERHCKDTPLLFRVYRSQHGDYLNILLPRLLLCLPLPSRKVDTDHTSC